jgi:hypothetical protein
MAINELLRFVLRTRIPFGLLVPRFADSNNRGNYLQRQQSHFFCFSNDRRTGTIIMSPQSTSPQRKFRLQFSLRMLLLLTAIVALGLTIFRWPWETTIVDQDISRTTRYRRGWNGKPLKNGPETVVSNDSQRKFSEALYEDGILRREQLFGGDGLLSSEKIYFPERGETLERHFGINHDRSTIAEIKIAADGLRVRREWRTTAGKLLESADYERKTRQEDFQLRQWNDRPCDEVFQELLSLLPPSQQDLWRMHTRLSNYFIDSYLGDATFRFSAGLPLHVDSPAAEPEAGLPPFQRGKSFLSPSHVDTPLIQDLFAHARSQHQTLQCRFGVICLVPIHAENMTPVDPTGVLSVQFNEGSRQKSAWLELVRCMDQRVTSPAQRLQLFFAETGIEIDVSQIDLPAEKQPTVQGFDGPKEPDSTWPGMPDFSYRRTRRDTLGMFLWTHRLRVEQQGNKLIVLPRSK